MVGDEHLVLKSLWRSLSLFSAWEGKWNPNSYVKLQAREWIGGKLRIGLQVLWMVGRYIKTAMLPLSLQCLVETLHHIWLTQGNNEKFYWRGAGYVCFTWPHLPAKSCLGVRATEEPKPRNVEFPAHLSFSPGETAHGVGICIPLTPRDPNTTYCGGPFDVLLFWSVFSFLGPQQPQNRYMETIKPTQELVSIFLLT